MSARNSSPRAREALADEAGHDVGLALMRTAFVMKQSLQRRLAAAEPRLSPVELAILHMLTLADGQRVGDLADASIRDRTTLTRIADRMVDKGLIERRTDAADRRAVLLFLTPLGTEAHAHLLPVRNELVERATEGLSERQKASLIKAAVSIRERLLDDLESDS